MSVVGSGFTSGPGTIKATTSQGKRYFYLFEEFSTFFNLAKIGFVIVLPLTVAFFSIPWALGSVGMGIASYWVGKLLQEFTYWYNSHNTELDIKKSKSQIDPSYSPTELEEILDRVRYFENKYYIGLDDMYRYLEKGQVPFPDNLDWIEVVSLLNRLSLNMGKHFDSSGNKKGKE